MPDFHRHDSLNANSFFNNLQGHPRALYRYNYYGFDVSGPIYLPKLLGGFNQSKTKLFFFYNEEWYKQLTPQASANNIEVPTAAERNGDFSQSVNGNGATDDHSRHRQLSGRQRSRAGTAFPGQHHSQVLLVPGIAGGSEYFSHAEYHRRGISITTPRRFRASIRAAKISSASITC